MASWLRCLAVVQGGGKLRLLGRGSCGEQGWLRCLAVVQGGGKLRLLGRGSCGEQGAGPQLVERELEQERERERERGQHGE